ncbi:MAG: 16S rRNA (guanine(527)-N(7))-methyltransferase RsmG [Proteobacteria bacterium]|nr:16S rRNA (guanine(527)-N(7))-methyltransferase RsmG [Pseudomonadota bacterium]
MSIADRANLYARLRAGLADLGLAPDAAACERLLDYVELLARWNAAYNLTAVRGPVDMVTRHLLDSLSVANYVRGDSLADLGTGAGLPGIPLAILAPQRTHTLIDSNGKKVRFLREAMRALELRNVRVEQSRVEDVRGQFDCITARAFATLGDMLRMGGHLLAPDGLWLALKGQLSQDEMLGVPAGFVVAQVVPLHVPDLGAARQLAIIKRTGAQERAA